MSTSGSSGANPRPLRVLLVITRGERGGAQVHVRDLLAGLKHRVDYHLIVGETGFVTEEADRLGVPCEVMPSLQRAVSPRTDARALRALVRAIDAVKPHLVHTHSTKAGLLGRLAARIRGVPVIHTAHAWSFSDGLSWKRRSWAIPVEWLAGRITDRFITVSEADKEVGTRWSVATDAQVRVVHNGVGSAAPRAEPAAEGTPRIVMVARMAPPKDHTLLLEALSAVQHPFVLRLVGDGPDRHTLERQAKALGIHDQIEWMGTRSDVADQLAASQVFALVSRQEGFPLAILEGMRAGLPVIASDVGGIREAVDHGRTGLLVPRGDLGALTEALDQMLSNPSLRSRHGAAGRREFTSRFSSERMCQATAAVYAALGRERGLPLPGSDR